MKNILLRHAQFFILFIFGSMISFQAWASTETEIVARLKLTLDILVREAPKIKTRKEANEFIRIHIIPITDISVTSKIMLGKHWRRASESQKRRFMAAITEQLVNIYSTFLINADVSNIKYNVIRITSKKGRLVTKYIVHGKITTSPPVDVTFIIYKREGHDWKIGDVSVEGISIAMNWRSTINSLIKRPGDLDKLIADLETKAVEIKENGK